MNIAKRAQQFNLHSEEKKSEGKKGKEKKNKGEEREKRISLKILEACFQRDCHRNIFMVVSFLHVKVIIAMINDRIIEKIK